MYFIIALALIIPSIAHSSEYLIGEIKARAEVDVMAQVDGLVSTINTDFGEQVNSRQILLAFDKTDAELELALAKANYDLAKIDSKLKQKQFKRLKKLNKNQSIADSELEEQQRQAQISEAQLHIENRNIAIAQRKLDKHTVKAPFTAHVTERYVEIGQWVNVGDPLYRLTDIRNVLVEAVLVEQDIADLKRGQLLNIHIPAVNKHLQAKTARIASAPQRDGSGYRIELELDNSDGLLKPGYRAELSVTKEAE